MAIEKALHDTDLQADCQYRLQTRCMLTSQGAIRTCRPCPSPFTQDTKNKDLLYQFLQLLIRLDLQLALFSGQQACHIFGNQPEGAGICNLDPLLGYLCGFGLQAVIFCSLQKILGVCYLQSFFGAGHLTLKEARTSA